jgi:hypothetical protein
MKERWISDLVEKWRREWKYNRSLTVEPHGATAFERIEKSYVNP